MFQKKVKIVHQEIKRKAKNLNLFPNPNENPNLVQNLVKNQNPNRSLNQI